MLHPAEVRQGPRSQEAGEEGSHLQGAQLQVRGGLLLPAVRDRARLRESQSRSRRAPIVACASSAAQAKQDGDERLAASCENVLNDPMSETP